MAAEHAVSRGNRPLAVDLDGTLVRTDLLVEGVVALLKEQPLAIFLLPLWLVKGKAYFKQQVAQRVDLDTGLLPYHRPFLGWLHEEHSAGRHLVLATASNIKFAAAVARQLGLFRDVLASDANTNLSGTRKRERLVAAFGAGGFDYAANGRVDLPIWTVAGRAILVSPARGVADAVAARVPVLHIFPAPVARSLGLYLRAMRPHQWLKNLLIFVPLVLAHKLGEPILVAQVLLASFAFGLCASSVYLLNDLLDLPADRQHPTKCQRPFAAGDLPATHGLTLMGLLLLLAFALASLLPPLFLGVLAAYYTAALAYSVRLKRALFLDVLVLAGLYTLRVIAGAAAVSVPLSFWLLAFSVFLFLSLALVKRFTELDDLRDRGRGHAVGRGYQTADIETLSQFGTASAYLAVLVLAHYINSEAVHALYRHPELIWLLCPLLLYILSRVWLLARRGQLHEDPLVFVLSDRRSYWLAALGASLLWAAT